MPILRSENAESGGYFGVHFFKEFQTIKKYFSLSKACGLKDYVICNALYFWYYSLDFKPAYLFSHHIKDMVLETTECKYSRC